MAWNANLTNLNDVLAGLYPALDESYRIVEIAGLNRTQIRFSAKALDNWYAILREADNQGKVADVIAAARRDYPRNQSLIQAEQGALTTARGPVIGREVPWKPTVPADTAEKIMAEQSTLLPISFLDVGLQRAKAVARVVCADGTLGTGFLIPGNLLLTNNHVLETSDAARSAQVEFNFQLNGAGLPFVPEVYQLDPDGGFATSQADDWTAVRVAKDASAVWGVVPLEPVTLDLDKTNYVNIIQHPGGRYKSIALYHNLVTAAGDGRIQYLTDTEPGSSGAPVFDSEWRLVALHHSGGWLPEPGTQQQVFRNQGIEIGRVIEGLQAQGLLG
jgi:hypothetical protein